MSALLTSVSADNENSQCHDYDDHSATYVGGQKFPSIEANDILRPWAGHLIAALDPWAGVSHDVSVDPINDVCIDISHFEQRRNLWVPGADIHPNHISNTQVAAVFNNHDHACFDVQKDRICFERCNGACMVNRHTPLASTAALVQE